MPVVMRRRPLLRAAAVGGGAYQIGKARAEAREREAYQDQRIAELETRPRGPSAAAPRGGLSAGAIERLQQLAKLHEQGVLTDEEFAAEKQKVLAG